MTTRQAAPDVYRAISRITAAFAREGIAKTHLNVIDQYLYRSIDDLYNGLAPKLARHGLCVLPRVLEREADERVGEQDSLLVNVRLLVAFDLVSARDGSSHTVQCWGEALDAGDKGTAKAMSAAFKSAMFELFCVPVGSDDPDGASHRLKRPVPAAEPVQGWAAWRDDIVDMIHGCESPDALDRVRTRHGKLLAALKRERPDDYASIGAAFATRGQQLAVPTPVNASGTKPARTAQPPKTIETVDA